MSETNLATQLSELILSQQQLASKLKSLLEQEQLLLTTEETQQMLAVVEQKEIIAKQMTSTQNQLNTLALQYNRADPDQRLVKLIQAVDESGELFQQWESLLEIAQSCKQLNEANGSTINLKQRYTENGLAILRGQSSNHNSTTYSKKGVRRTGNQGARTLFKA